MPMIYEGLLAISPLTIIKGDIKMIPEPAEVT